MNRTLANTTLDRGDLNLSDVSVYMMPGRALQAQAMRVMLHTVWRLARSWCVSRSRPLDEPYCAA